MRDNKVLSFSQNMRTMKAIQVCIRAGMSTSTLSAGLYIVATPIGYLEDITLRAIRVLKECDRIACEDTRVSRKLLTHLQINKPLFVYHDHNEQEGSAKLLHFLRQGEKIALISDAGMPLIADPGFKVVQACYEHNLPVTVVPGPTAFVNAAILSAFPTMQISFLGFASNLGMEQLSLWQSVQSTLVLFEAPHKLVRSLESLQVVFPNRRVAVVREMTKMFEEVIRGEWSLVLEHFTQTAPKGELVIVLSPPETTLVDESQMDAELQQLLHQHSIKDAVQYVAGKYGIARRSVYARALTLAQKNENPDK